MWALLPRCSLLTDRYRRITHLTAQARGLTPDDAYLFETVESAQRKEEQQRKKEKGRAAFGWDVFNQDSLFKAYKKRLAKLPTVRKGGASVGLVVWAWACPCAYSPIPVVHPN